MPTYDLEVGAARTIPLGDYLATVGVERGKATVSIAGADGKTRKSVPAVVRREYAAELADLRAAKDVSTMLSAQRCGSSGCSWTSAPGAGRLARALPRPPAGRHAGPPAHLACRDRQGRRHLRVFPTGTADVGGRHRSCGTGRTGSSCGTRSRPPAEVVAWRDWLERHRVPQPFKQAHREVYLLTDAERRTGTYSNRFAAHVLRQHQFHALAAARGWRYRLQASVRRRRPAATRELPQWGLRAEFWVEGVGDDDEADTRPGSAHLRAATDQVRFYDRRGDRAASRSRSADGARRCVAVSEVMRDVDLFVGVASVGNDPTWDDGGARRPVPRLLARATPSAICRDRPDPPARCWSGWSRGSKIADRCTLDGPVPGRRAATCAPTRSTWAAATS